jgi:diguanylate cyclase (GGDEF)-like protein
MGSSQRTKARKKIRKKAGSTSKRRPASPRHADRLRMEQALREGEARFRSLSRLSSDWFWEQDTEFRFTHMEGRHVTGDNSAFANEIGMTREELGVEVEGGWEAHRALLEAHRPFRDVIMWRMTPDGLRHYMSISGEPMFGSQGRFTGYRGVGKDISERRHDELMISLEHAVNLCLAETDDVAKALKKVISTICEAQHWECGRYLRVDEAAGVLRFCEAWGVPNKDIQLFIDESLDMAYKPGVGVIGNIWQTGQPTWVADISHDARVVRKGLAHEIGLRGAFGVVIPSAGKTIGVLIFHSREIREPNKRLLQAVRVIGSQIGQFVQRKGAEQASLRLGRMFAALSATNDAILHAKSPEALYQQVCDATVHGGKFSNTSIFLAEEGNTEVRAVAGAGRIPQDLMASHISIDETLPEGRGLIGIAYRTQRACVSNDFLNDERTRPWHETGRQANCRAAAALPLVQGGRCVGVVFIHYDELNAFDDEIVKLLERLAANVSFALDNFAHEAERKSAQERIEHLAMHDGLTDLPNRAMFSQVLNLAIASARRYKRHFAVLFIDLDRFKIINDTLGHEAGDVLLQEVSRRVKDILRSSDFVARLGGDEFVVLVQEVSEAEQVAIVARKLLSTIIKPVVIVEQECRVTASIGISMYPKDAQDEQSLMKNADLAMYLAKEEGKNNFQFYSEDIKTQSLERLTLETSLRRALEREEFFLHYQAKLDLRTGAITGVETLVRWQHPDLGLVSPLQFIPLAEETGLIVPIGMWVLRTACAQNVAWQRAGLPPVCMAVNLSPRQFSSESLLSDIASVLRETGMSPNLLELEITESMVMGNVDRAAKQLTAINQMGVRLAIDDFGTGYSSLAQIKRFPIDTIKVDRSFIREIPHNDEDKALTEAIIALGKSLSITVVAEGVETKEQQTFLREHACDEMQGFYFSKPVAPEQFAELLRGHVPVPTPQK